MNRHVIWNEKSILDRPKSRIEFPDLILFRNHWYCGFREGLEHENHPSGRGRIIRSSDGENWETVWLCEWQGGDVREPKLSITAEGQLMINTSIYFVSKDPKPVKLKPDGEYTPPEADKPRMWHFQLEEHGTPASRDESSVARQSVTWLSANGTDWTSAYTCSSGINLWRWAVTWHDGMGYSVGYGGVDQAGTLYRTRDGKCWRPLKEKFFPKGEGNEAALAFDERGRAICLLRDACPEAGPMLGISNGPRYQEWEWSPLRVDEGRNGDFKAYEEIFVKQWGAGPSNSHFGKLK